MSRAPKSQTKGRNADIIFLVVDVQAECTG